MIWLLYIAGGLTALIAAVVVIGMLVPQNHSATRTARFQQSAETIWTAITDHANEPAWRTGLVKKERLDDRNGHPVWRETDKRGQRMTFEAIVFEPPRRMVGRIIDDNLPFGGSWTYEIKSLADDANACTLTITEDGEIYNPVFRFVARFILGYRGTMDAYLAALSRKFGQPLDFVE